MKSEIAAFFAGVSTRKFLMQCVRELLYVYKKIFNKSHKVSKENLIIKIYFTQFIIKLNNVTQTNMKSREREHERLINIFILNVILFPLSVVG